MDGAPAPGSPAPARCPPAGQRPQTAPRGLAAAHPTLPPGAARRLQTDRTPDPGPRPPSLTCPRAARGVSASGGPTTREVGAAFAGSGRAPAPLPPLLTISACRPHPRGPRGLAPWGAARPGLVDACGQGRPARLPPSRPDLRPPVPAAAGCGRCSQAALGPRPSVRPAPPCGVGLVTPGPPPRGQPGPGAWGAGPLPASGPGRRGEGGLSPELGPASRPRTPWRRRPRGGGRHLSGGGACCLSGTLGAAAARSSLHLHLLKTLEFRTDLSVTSSPGPPAAQRAASCRPGPPHPPLPCRLGLPAPPVQVVTFCFVPL